MNSNRQVLSKLAYDGIWTLLFHGAVGYLSGIVLAWLLSGPR